MALAVAEAEGFADEMADGALADCPTVSGKESDDDMANDDRHDRTLSDHDRCGDADEQSIAAAR